MAALTLFRFPSFSRHSSKCLSKSLVFVRMPFRRRKRFRRGGRYRRGRRRLIGASCSAPFESKVHDVTYASDAFATTTAAIDHAAGESLLLIPQGVDNNERVGRSICVSSIQVDGRIRLVAGVAASGGHNLVKVQLVLDKQCNGADATILDVVETATIDSYRNLANAKRFKILATKVINLQGSFYGNGTDTKSGPVGVPFTLYKKLSLPVVYDSTAGAVTELQTNNLFLMGSMSESVTANFLGKVRIRFTG